jgi:hypothetical protein
VIEHALNPLNRKVRMRTRQIEKKFRTYRLPAASSARLSSLPALSEPDQLTHCHSRLLVISLPLYNEFARENLRNESAVEPENSARPNVDLVKPPPSGQVRCRPPRAGDL